MIKNTVPVGQTEVIWSSAQNLTAITDNNAQLVIITRQYTQLHPHALMDALQTYSTTHAHKKHTDFHDVNTLKNLLTQASELLTRPPLARFSKRIQVAFISHTGHQCPEPLPPTATATTTPTSTAVVNLCTSTAATVAALATGTFNSVATSS